MYNHFQEDNCHYKCDIHVLKKIYVKKKDFIFVTSKTSIALFHH